MIKITLITAIFCFVLAAQEWNVDQISDWQEQTDSSENLDIREAADWGGVIDLMGNGALLLQKVQSDSLYTRVSEFQTSGKWVSKWHDFGTESSMRSIETSIIGYGKKLDMRKGWIKFSGNPVLSGGNTLLPLNPENITEETILLPTPGGVPQDQSIVRGRGIWEGKWVLFFNHTPDAWPNDYYWSAALADNLFPLKEGINPFTIDTLHFPLFGPIDNHAPNDWLEVNGITYAPDENHEGDSHMWKSEDMINWIDMGPIQGINGSDPGMTFDGRYYYLFNESGERLNYNRLSADFTRIDDGGTVLDVEDHTGDADLAYFNNQWHMFFDDGQHLHYNIGHAVTSPEEFPFGWIKENDIYGPHNPEQGQRWDDDTKDGNDFGTGDADIALEGNTLYMFTERPVGAAFKELDEILDNTGLHLSVLVETDSNGDGVTDDSTGWRELGAGKAVLSWPQILTGRYFRVSFKFETENISETPLVQYFRLTSIASKPIKLEMESDKQSMLNFRDPSAVIECRLVNDEGKLTVGADSLVTFSLIGSGELIGENPALAQQGKVSIHYKPGAAVGRQMITARSAGLIADTVYIDVDDRICVDDFELYESDEVLGKIWQGYPGLTAELMLSDDERPESEKVMQYVYRVGSGSPPYSGIFRDLNFDLSGINYLGLWLTMDGSSRDLIIRLIESGGRQWDYSLDLNDSLPSFLTVNLDEFTANDGSEIMDLSSLTNLSFYVLPGSGGYGTDTLFFDDISFLHKAAVPIDDERASRLASDFKLEQNHPNPFNPSTAIGYQLSDVSKVDLSIYNILGQKVSTVFSGTRPAGYYKTEWDGSAFASGIYYCVMKTNSWYDANKMVLLK